MNNTTKNEQYNMLCAEILEPTLRKISLSFCVTVSEFYDAVHELTFTFEDFLAEEAFKMHVPLDPDKYQGYDRIAETVKSKKRLYRLADRLRLKQDCEIHADKQLLLEPKIYDRCIYDAMISTYGSISEAIGDSLFNTFDTQKVKRSLQIEDRAGFSFSEFAMYVCLYMAIKKSAVETLNKPAETVNQKKRLKGRMQLIKQWLFSHAFRTVLIRTLIDLLAKFNEDEYSLLLEKHYRDYWLPNDKRGLKYINYALELYSLDFPNITHTSLPSPKPTLFPEVETFAEDPAVVQSFIIENERINLFQEFFFNVQPVLILIAEGILPRQLSIPNSGHNDTYSIDVRPYILNSPLIDNVTKKYVRNNPSSLYTARLSTYELAITVCDVIDTYIDAVINSVVTFLECLPEANIAGKGTLIEYLNTI